MSNRKSTTKIIILILGFMFVTSIPKSSTYGTLREIRIVAQNYSSWEYKACVADAYHGIGKVYSLNINSNYSYELLPETAPNNGTMNYALTSIQGLTDCGYAALVVCVYINTSAPFNLFDVEYIAIQCDRRSHKYCGSRRKYQLAATVLRSMDKQSSRNFSVYRGTWRR